MLNMLPVHNKSRMTYSYDFFLSLSLSAGIYSRNGQLDFFMYQYRVPAGTNTVPLQCGGTVLARYGTGCSCRDG
jgi:hypothetical protein